MMIGMMIMKEYVPRIIDKTLQEKLTNYGVVIIEGQNGVVNPLLLNK